MRWSAGTHTRMPADSTNQKRSVTMQVPPDAAAGDVLSFVVDGNELDISVPPGSNPGDVLEIQLFGTGVMESNPASNENDDEKDNYTSIEVLDDKSIAVSVFNGEKLHFSTTLNSKEDTVGKENKSEREEGRDDGTSAYLWPSGNRMTQFLGSSEGIDLIQSIYLPRWNGLQPGAESVKCDSGSESNTSSLDVLELGAGLGIVGLSFAANVSSVLPRIRNVVLSDVPGALPLLQHNVQKNKSLLDPTIVKAIPLLWESQNEQDNQVSAEDGPQRLEYRLLLASDVLYNTDSIPSLISTVKRYLATTSNSALLLAVRWRKPELERSFFQALEGWQGKHWELVHTLHCPLSWESYGDPKDDRSNQYFHQTMIPVKGKPHSLAEIMEQAVDKECTTGNRGTQNFLEAMSDEESEVFENCYIQIYLLNSDARHVPDSRENYNGRASRKRSLEESSSA